MIFGSEDDEGDLHEIVFGACAGYKFTAEQAATALANCTYYHYTKHSGAIFLRSVLDKVLERDKPDLVVLNPFQGYLGGSIHDTELTTTFIRNTLLPIVEKHNCAAMLVHHTRRRISETRRTGPLLIGNTLRRVALTSRTRCARSSCLSRRASSASTG